jgi:hypothetical protein
MLLAVVAYSFWTYNAKAARDERMKKAKPRDFFIAGSVIAAIVIVANILSASAQISKKAELRQQFALSDDIELVDFEFRNRPKTPNGYRVRATYRFTDLQLARYRAGLDDAALWKPHVLERIGRTMIGRYTYDARRWNDFPRALRAADVEGMHIRDLPWLYHLWWGHDGWQTVENGRIMCFVFRDTMPRASRWNDDPDRYDVSACSQLPKKTRVFASVLGILDYDAKTLSVTID